MSFSTKVYGQGRRASKTNIPPGSDRPIVTRFHLLKLTKDMTRNLGISILGPLADFRDKLRGGVKPVCGGSSSVIFTALPFPRNRMQVANGFHPFEGMCNFTRTVNTVAMKWLWLFCLLGLMLPMTLCAANAPSGLLCDLLAHPEETVITNTRPQFGWIYNPSFRNDSQSGYHIIVASSRKRADAGVGDVWDSGWISNSLSINVPYAGTPLAIGADFFWRVQTSDSVGQVSSFSIVQHFITGSATNVFAGRYPLKFVPATPVLLTNTAPGRWFADFGQDAFGYAKVHVNGTFNPTTVQVRFGEMSNGFAVDTTPPAGSSVRYTNTTFDLVRGNSTYSIRPPEYSRPAGAINPPGCGAVMPFRYLELTNFPGTLAPTDVVQMRLLSYFNTNAASFNSSSTALNRIWNLCRNSMQILTFDGIYVDGDRERTPYEADAYIHQLSSYAVDREFTLPRHSLEYLLHHPTWPTEWKFYDIFMAWADYLQTGNTNLLNRYYKKLQTDSFTWAATGNGLMKGFPGFPQTTDSDVVDWPPCDRDGFVIKKGAYRNWTNSVNNAFYYHGLRLMANIATVLGRANDAATYTAKAKQVYATYNATFWNNTAQCYVDGVGTDHAAAHANFFPLAFGLVPAGRQTAVVNFLHSRIADDGGMPCSVYGAQYLLQALFDAGDADTALGLITTNGPRGWLNMIHLGSTLTTEAWNFKDKPNMDWNHAWGAAPGNLIARFILGLRPIAAGFGKILIQPQLGKRLTFARGVVPTIRGPVGISASNAPGNFQLLLNIPGNVTATVKLPTLGSKNPVALVDGEIVSGALSNNWLTVTNVGAGQHAIWLNTNSAPSPATLYANWAAGWFGTNATNPSIAGPAVDADGDGESNYNEFIAGTNPLDASDRFRITHFTYAPGPMVIVAVTGQAGRHYMLQHTRTLISPVWSTADTQTASADNQAIQLRDTKLDGSEATFLRVVVTYP
jgi:alpha-L-rhamnosidase